ncbi:arginine-ornithine antiporter [Neobacillus muris]|uniref:arginine-ornithine antiporter n=1 Tax=Neobacillus muris TaxID=2941334 RepID=UPI0020412971|nr:arginine-ornithine antiporter [Neobacillus muris]
MQNNDKKLGLLALVALVIGSQIGGGGFNVAADMAAGANAGAILIGWVITGIGMFALVFSFQNLTNKHPNLEGGIYSFAKAGFGSYLGFSSAWGYWLSVWLGNIAFLTLLFSALGYFFPVFTGGNLPSIIGASIFLWVMIFIILRGVQSAALVNLVVTIGKLIPIFLFIIIALFAFHLKTLSYHFWGSDGFSLMNLLSQIKSTMLVSLWVFTGVEGAVVLSSRARHKKDVGKATVIGLSSTLIIYICLSILSLGAMPHEELTDLKSPAMAYVLESIVGPWGAAFINLGLIVSLLGALLGWMLFAAEIPYIAAKDGTFPEVFAKQNRRNVPMNSLVFSGVLIQLFLLTLLVSQKPYNFAFSMASSAILVPYLFSALYQVKVSFQLKEKKQMAVGLIASLYAVWILYAAGLDYLLLTAVLYALGIILFIYSQKERKKKVFQPFELVCAGLIVAIAVYSIFMLAAGGISI